VTGAEAAGEDWGESAGAKLALAKEANSCRRFERHFQLLVLLLLSFLAICFALIDAFKNTSFAQDTLVILPPLFSFVLGKLDNKDR
jgi:hypothetical protein